MFSISCFSGFLVPRLLPQKVTMMAFLEVQEEEENCDLGNIAEHAIHHVGGL